jgi:hypothetical protein
MRAAVAIALVLGIGHDPACDHEPAQAIPAVPALQAEGTAPPRATAPWTEAFDALARQADAGSVPAARLALEMVRFGPRLYGARFDASPQQLRRWRSQLQCAAPPCAGSG